MKTEETQGIPQSKWLRFYHMTINGVHQVDGFGFLVFFAIGALTAIFAGWFYTLYAIVKPWKGCA